MAESDEESKDPENAADLFVVVVLFHDIAGLIVASEASVRSAQMNGLFSVVRNKAEDSEDLVWIFKSKIRN